MAWRRGRCDGKLAQHRAAPSGPWAYLGREHVPTTAEGGDGGKAAHSRCSCRRTSGWRFSRNMKRVDLEHILRASKGTTGETEFVIIGSQAILGRHPDAPRASRPVRGGVGELPSTRSDGW